MINVKKTLSYIFAEEENYSLEHRLFLSVTFIGTLASILGSVINIILDVALPAIIIPLALSVLLMCLYYFIRFKRLSEPIVFVTAFVGLIGIAVIWIFNGGMNGVNIMPAFVILMLSLIIVPESKKKFVILFFLCLFFGVYLLEYFRPDLIVKHTSEKDRWFDSASTFLYCSYFIYLIIRFLHKHYTLERLKSEESEEKYRMLTENMKDVVWILDAETLRYNYVSPSVLKLRGFTPDEVMATTIETEFPPEDADLIQSQFLQRLEELKTRRDNQPRYYTDEMRHLHKDGSIVYSEVVHEYYINKKNNRIELRGVTRDISERKRADQRIQNQNQELNNLNAEKDRFLSIIAHDLKGPFHSIIGLSDFLVRKVNEKDLEGIEKYAETIRQSSHRVMDLLSNLMLWSYSQTGRMRFNPEYFMLDNLINDVLMLFYETAKQKSLSIKTDISPNTQAFADKSMISTVLRNLISNAIKFSLPEGTISIIVEEHKKELKVKVCDTGIGIPKESIGRLFRIDQNRSTPGTQNEQGTGLGLILCKEFIEKHGGIIGVESNHDGEKESKGSTFYFTIPPEFK